MFTAILRKYGNLVVREMTITANTEKELNEKILNAFNCGYKLIKINKAK
jgi:hypothetical protein